METSRKVWESSCRRKRQDVDGREVFEEAGTRDRALSTDKEGLVDGMQWAPRPREWVRAKYANC